MAHKIQALQEDLAEEKDEEEIAVMLKELGELQHAFESSGGYDAEHEARTILSGLGFAEADFYRPLSEFSGGWLTRIELAKLLFFNPDLLILDEPTNHLDLETQRWFENYLKGYHGAVMVTSHDRAFLNNVARKIIAIEKDDVIFYHGDYDGYVLAREKELEIKQATARRQEQKIQKEMRFIERFRYKSQESFTGAEPDKSAGKNRPHRRSALDEEDSFLVPGAEAQRRKSNHAEKHRQVI